MPSVVTELVHRIVHRHGATGALLLQVSKQHSAFQIGCARRASVVTARGYQHFDAVKLYVSLTCCLNCDRKGLRTR